MSRQPSRSGRTFFFGLFAILTILVLLLLRSYLGVIALALVTVVMLKPLYDYFIDRKRVKNRPTVATTLTLVSFFLLLSRLDERFTILTSDSRDLPIHQRTLRATIDWSYNLVEESEKSFFNRPTVKTLSRPIDAINAICMEDLDLDVLDAIDSLVNKSLLLIKEVPGDEPRFFMLETLHEFAREKLAFSGEEKHIRRRHLDYFMDLAEDMDPKYRERNQLYFLNQTETELGNFRSAFYWALESGLA